MFDCSANEFLGVDFGGTKLNAGLVLGDKITVADSVLYSPTGSKEEVMDFLLGRIGSLITHNVKAIGIGVPSLVDVDRGVVFEAVNIPSWQDVHLKEIVEQKFGIHTYVNNDVNCFVQGESAFGAAKGYSRAVGICLGTGLGVGLLVNRQLYNGKNCGAGELGMLPFNGGYLEDFCSGSYFKKKYPGGGREAYELALAGNQPAIEVFREFGKNLASAISTVLLAYDPDVIVLGGSVSKSYSLFAESLHNELQRFPYKKVVQDINLRISESSDSAVLGAAYLAQLDYATHSFGKE